MIIETYQLRAASAGFEIGRYAKIEVDGVDYTPSYEKDTIGHFIVEVKPETNEITGEVFDVYGSVEEVQTIFALKKYLNVF